MELYSISEPSQVGLNKRHLYIYQETVTNGLKGGSFVSYLSTAAGSAATFTVPLLWKWILYENPKETKSVKQSSNLRSVM